MKIVSARIKQEEYFPPQELCCEEVKTMIAGIYGLPMKVDLDDRMDYSHITGHCDQPLKYRMAVKVVESAAHPAAEGAGYVPFEIIDIAEGEIA